MPGAGPGIVTRDSEGGGSLHQARPAVARLFVLAEDDQAAGDFRVSLDEAAKVAAEAILVELVGRPDVPQAARIRGDLVGDDDAHHIAFPQPAGLHLEIDETDADAEEKARQEIVDPD